MLVHVLFVHGVCTLEFVGDCLGSDPSFTGYLPPLLLEIIILVTIIINLVFHKESEKESVHGKHHAMLRKE